MAAQGFLASDHHDRIGDFSRQIEDRLREGGLHRLCSDEEWARALDEGVRA